MIITFSLVILGLADFLILNKCAETQTDLPVGTELAAQSSKQT